MKKCFLYSIMLSLLGCAQNNGVVTGKVSSVAQLQELFGTPPVQYRSAPLWVWNDDVTEKQIAEQLTDFKENGIWGVFVHPRPGLITPYLSDRWHSLFRYTVDRARELGMHVWIYDENSYPSGFAGGHVPAEMPESYNQGQGLTLTRLEKFPEQFDRDYYLMLKKDGDNFVDITGNFINEKGKTGDYYLFELKYYNRSPWFGGYSYVDLLYEGVTEKFIELTMQGYEKSSLGEFGSVVPGIFTDEPNINPPGDMKWTPALFTKFQQRWGYDLKTSLPSLWFQVGDWQRVRHNYYALLLELFIERWSKPWFNYCEQKGLQWTGHYWEHGWPDPKHGPDNMAMYAWHHVPAIDVLMNQYSKGVHAQFGNVRAVKELIGAANQSGRIRTLSETYGAGGWDLRFEDMKRIADWQYVLGVNFLNQHLSFITITGARKRDHPQSFSYHEPWWKFYGKLADYSARLSLALSSGQQVYTILVLEPTTTAWMYVSSGEKEKKFVDLGQTFQDFLFELEKYQIEYDLGSENIIHHLGEVDRGKFIIGARTYDLVVLPPTFENLDTYTAELLQQYLQQGGRVLSFNDVPTFIDGSATDKMSRTVAQFTGQWLKAKSVNEPQVLEQLAAKDFRVLQPETITGELLHHRRQLKDGQLLLLTNTSMEAWARGTLAIAGKSVKELNAMTGAIGPYPVKRTGDQLEIAFNLPPVGALLLVIDDSKVVPKTGSTEITESKILTALTKVKIARSSPNTLVLDYCDLTLPGATIDRDIYFFKAADKIFRHYGLNGNPWSRAVQYKTNILDQNNLPQNSGFEATFSLDVDAGIDHSSLRAVVERPELWQLSVNGHIVDPLPGKFWLDQVFGVYEIGQYLKTGTNELSLIAAKMTIHSELEPIYLLGDFDLTSQEQGWKLIPPREKNLGAWQQQGLPLYADGVSYTKSYEIQETGKTYRVQLPNWYGSVAEVLVNNKHAGIIGWPPNELDISEHVATGANEISVIVYGTLKNLLGPHHNNPPRGAAWPGQFEAAPEHQPAGDSYDVIGYGLFEDFEVVEIARK